MLPRKRWLRGFPRIDITFLGIFFLLPCALSIAELDSAFPQEAGQLAHVKLVGIGPKDVVTVKPQVIGSRCRTTVPWPRCGSPRV
jgi:hypothetical protein